MFGQRGLVEGKEMERRTVMRRLKSLVGLTLVGCSGVRVHTGADIPTAAPCCRPAVAQGGESHDTTRFT